MVLHSVPVLQCSPELLGQEAARVWVRHGCHAHSTLLSQEEVIRTWIWLAGPTGKILLLPEDQNAVHIWVATGTGIAPYRAFWRRFFLEEVEGHKFTGGASLSLERRRWSAC